MSSFRDLRVWQQSMDLVVAIYQTTQTFPTEERFGLTSQLRRASVSIPSNIAEGQGRLSTGEKRQFLGSARGSLYEVETQLTVAERLGYLNDISVMELRKQTRLVGRSLTGFLNFVSQQHDQKAAKKTTTEPPPLTTTDPQPITDNR